MKKMILIVLFCTLFTLIGYYLYSLSPFSNSTPKEEEGIEQKEPETPPSSAVPLKDIWSLLLVNKDLPIPSEYTPNLTYFTPSHQVDSRILQPLTALFEGGKNAGIDLALVSAHRTFQRSGILYQQQVDTYLNKGYSQKRAEEEAGKWVAPPGTSEHHTGLAVDILTPSYTTLDHGFAETKAAKWLARNAHLYGFVLRYPKDKESITKITFEPWHYRYVGEEHALTMVTENLTLEEYLKKYS